jgi:hypothetical protein
VVVAVILELVLLEQELQVKEVMVVLRQVLLVAVAAVQAVLVVQAIHLALLEVRAVLEQKMQF